jgi:hypothetical protein
MQNYFWRSEYNFEFSKKYGSGNEPQRDALGSGTRSTVDKTDPDEEQCSFSGRFKPHSPILPHNRPHMWRFINSTGFITRTLPVPKIRPL